jgi:hypothetical protein
MTASILFGLAMLGLFVVVQTVRPGKGLFDRP